MKVNIRRDTITDLVNQAGAITVEELAEQLNASANIMAAHRP